MTKKKRLVYRRQTPIADDNNQRYYIEGPLKKRASVETPFGEAMAEAGTYTAENVDTGEKHVIHPKDLERLYVREY